MPSSFWLLPLLLWAGAVTADQPLTADFPRIEVFTLSRQPIAANTAAISPQMVLQQYELDRIRLLETRLSRELPADPKQAEAIVLDRFQHLDRATSDSLRQSAVGLAKAMQYGIDRIPAIVFDGQASGGAGGEGPNHGYLADAASQTRVDLQRLRHQRSRQPHRLGRRPHRR